MSSYVPYFAAEMQKEMDDNCHKTGWWNLSIKQCLNRLRQETGELSRAIEQNKSKKEITSECADVANFAMFISHNYKQMKDDYND